MHVKAPTSKYTQVSLKRRPTDPLAKKKRKASGEGGDGQLVLGSSSNALVQMKEKVGGVQMRENAGLRLMHRPVQQLVCLAWRWMK
jgi:hypothetical protein